MITARGELAERIDKNINRLSDDLYCVPTVFKHNKDWPGDWLGRTILALCSQYVAVSCEDTKRKIMFQLQSIMDDLSKYTNTDGYFGDVFDGKSVNEQQLSGNSWFIRGLCEYYFITKDDSIILRLNHIANQFLSKLQPFYENYPLVDREEGGVGGHLLQMKVNNWLLSSDIACAYILLDGITQLYEVTRNEKMVPIIETMIKNFISIDFVQKNCQTHATLSGVRGLLRYMQISGKTELLTSIETIFELYFSSGMTLNYANFNWFGRPLWTEPCAIVDSILVAEQLFQATKKRKYVEFCNRVYLNAIRSCERKNGGAGCETCLSEDNDILKVYLYEAEFCCSMRLAEGLKHITKFSVLQETDVIQITSLHDFSYTNSDIWFEQKFNFSINSTLTIKVDCARKTEIQIYMPRQVSVTGNFEFTIQDDWLVIQNTGKNEYTFLIHMKVHTEILRGIPVHFLGDTILTEKQYKDTSKIQVTLQNRLLSPIENCMEFEQLMPLDKLIQKI